MISQFLTNTNMMKPVIFCLGVAILSSCGSGNSKNDTGKTDTLPSTTETTSQTPAPAADAETGMVSFKVNDTLASTKKGGSNDSEAQLGLYTDAVKNLSFDLLGDVPGRAHRGWLHFSIQGFTFEPATYSLSKDNHVTFTRYETANAGGASDYIADHQNVNKGTEMTIIFTSLTREASGNRWLASGSFSAKLYNKIYSNIRASTEEVKISEGTFENVPIAGGPSGK